MEENTNNLNKEKFDLEVNKLADSIIETPVENTFVDETNSKPLAKRLYELTLQGYENDIKSRQNYGCFIIGTVFLWLVFVGIVIILQGFKFHDFTLSDIVLNFLLCTTTANIIGLLVIVLKYLFKGSPSLPELPKSLENDCEQI